METLCTEKRYGKLAFQTLFVQDVYAAKGSKTFWLYSIGYYKKWGNSKNNIY